MSQSFPDNYEKIANDMGIALYQRFSISEASLFLRCSEKDVLKLLDSYDLNYIRVTKTEVQFFGFQLLDYLLGKVTDNAPKKRAEPKVENILPERIIRIEELLDMTGLSRTTIWRMEKAGTFPKRVSLGEASIGWRFSEISEWIKSR